MDGAGRQLAPGLRLRTSRPEIPPGHVRLHRIDAALAACSPGQVAVVTAGPGYGKTLAVAAWTRAHPPDGTLAWLAVDDTSGVPSFWNDILGALGAAGALPPDSSLCDIVPGVGFTEQEVDLVIDGLADSPAPITLVLDDIQWITRPEVLESIHHLIRRQPERLRLILITRKASDLRLQKLRLDGRLTAITAADLTFTRDDVIEFCVRARTEVSDDDIDTLLERTQGWPTGLRLAVLSARDDDLHARVAQFTGQNELVAAYLLEEVLEDLAPTDRRFLLSTSVVEVMTADLARTLSGRADSRRVLDDLVADNVLTVRLSDRPDWYAYHPLFRELLADRLAAENPDAPADLHRRAAEWFVAEDDPISAIRHYASARDWAMASQVLSTIALPLVLSPQAPALAAALAPVEAEAGRRPTVDTLLAAAIVAYQAGDFEVMARNANDASRLLRDGPEAATVGTRIVIALTRMVTARHSHLEDIVASCDAILDLVSEVPRSAVPAAPAYALIARNNRAIGMFQIGEIDTAAADLEYSRMAAESIGMSLMAMAAGTYLTLVDLVRGELPETRRRVEEIAAVASRRGWTRQPQAIALYAAAALMHLECHELEQADHAVALGRRAVAGGSDTGAWLIVEAAAVGIAIARGDAYAVRAACRRLDLARSRSRSLPALLSSWHDVVTAEARIVTGESDAVIVESAGRARDASYADSLARVVLAKAYLAVGRPAEALDTLGTTAEFAPYRLQVVEAEVLSAVASAQLHREAVALEHIAAAVRLAEPVGQKRPFVVAGPLVAGLLLRHQRLAGKESVFLRDLVTVCGAGSSPVVDAGIPIEPLTDRELVVLRYLPTMYKASEIAADLFVSVNTVKTHQQSIYRKLGVSTRRDAVDRARERNLI
ncbi:LuxR C-terminal-related transcriptional regulator [Gordonia sp. ABSL11-1]|uniref:LuxR C-terminal-related transcriptional regulator n=1 Tax=Gordonia sp. ABSL11-1 TaxID=3053924 RepID=UPI0025736243|nr:LuxR C-terminal-related transcriptional regulator [Gordonia sp. ABSL11-1]MDL9947029.1 LuxR C-terminal-related transcriptional regulator [Gordonia sp. ABSL11-1]